MHTIETEIRFYWNTFTCLKKIQMLNTCFNYWQQLSQVITQLIPILPMFEKSCYMTPLSNTCNITYNNHEDYKNVIDM